MPPETLPALLPTIEWDVRVLGRPCGQLGLFRTPAGYVWKWKNKPKYLVPLVGVLDDTPTSPKNPYWFFEPDAAIGHLMDFSGFAFDGKVELSSIPT